MSEIREEIQEAQNLFSYGKGDAISKQEPAKQEREQLPSGMTGTVDNGHYRFAQDHHSDHHSANHLPANDDSSTDGGLNNQ